MELPPPFAAAPPPMPAPPVRRLVRDPYSRLGGVASGVAHYYGLDVSLVRIITVLLALTTGVGLLAYLLAWLIIPRADYWPPAAPPRGARSISNRDLGIGLAAIGLLFALAIGGGGAGGFLVPLVLVGGGVWLLLQPPSAVAAGTVSATGTAHPSAPAPAAGGWSGGEVPPPSAYMASPPPGPVGAPVPRRSRWRRLGLVALVALGVLTLVAIPLLVVAGFFFVAVGSDDAAFEVSSVEYQVGTDSFPLVIDRDEGEIVIDLTDLDTADFDDLPGPALVDARVDFGRIEVIVPEDLEVSVRAATQLGGVEVFSRSNDGIRADLRIDGTDPDIELRLDVGAGEIEVRRG